MLTLIFVVVMSDSLQPHELQHTRLSCPSLSPRVCSNSCPWVRDAIQPFYPLSPPSPLALNLSQYQGLFRWVNFSISIGASASVPPMNIQGWFPLGLTGLISLQSKGILRVFSSTTIWKHQFFSAQPSLWSNSHICTWLLEKPCVCLVTHLCPTLCNPMDYSPLGSCVHGILQTRLLVWVAIPISRGSSPPRDWPGSPALQADSLPSDPPGKTIALTIMDLCQQSNISVF